MRNIAKPLLAGGALAGAATGLAWRQVRGLRQTDEPPGPGNPFLRRYGPWALVTGAARAEGLGYSFARHLAGRGFNLVLVDIAGDELAARAAELQAKYLIKVRPIVLDLGSEDFLGALLAQTADITVGMLVCNHMWTPKSTPTIMEMDLATHMGHAGHQRPRLHRAGSRLRPPDGGAGAGRYPDRRLRRRPADHALHRGLLGQQGLPACAGRGALV
ncbi:MAG: SDR family NAD(P)-dependent oxidoreductase [Anaerolineae bacterium]